MTAPVSIGEMEAADWPRVRDIYLEGIATGNATFETAAPPWEEWSAKHLPRHPPERPRRASHRASLLLVVVR